VDLRGFGSFIIKQRAARDARNPATREIVRLKERFIPAFKVSKILKNVVNKSLLRGF
jgi:nucleoid DNA-binding protein